MLNYSPSLTSLETFKQLIRFGFIGSLSAGCTYTLLYWQISVLNISPILANCIAVSFASIISFTGHKLFTFKTKKNAQQHLVRFYLLLCSNFLLNQCLFSFILYGLHFSYHIAFLVSSAFLPIYSFLMNKFWVFKSI